MEKNIFKVIIIIIKNGSSQFGLAGELPPGPCYGIAKRLFYPLGSRTGECASETTERSGDAAVCLIQARFTLGFGQGPKKSWGQNFEYFWVANWPQVTHKNARPLTSG